MLASKAIYYVVPVQHKKVSELSRATFSCYVWTASILQPCMNFALHSQGSVKNALFSRMNRTKFLIRFFCQNPQCDALLCIEPIQRPFWFALLQHSAWSKLHWPLYFIKFKNHIYKFQNYLKHISISSQIPGYIKITKFDNFWNFENRTAHYT
jgi:hypothetical protein